jgi:hypothetical protein
LAVGEEPMARRRQGRVNKMSDVLESERLSVVSCFMISTTSGGRRARLTRGSTKEVRPGRCTACPECVLTLTRRYFAILRRSVLQNSDAPWLVLLRISTLSRRRKNTDTRHGEAFHPWRVPGCCSLLMSFATPDSRVCCGQTDAYSWTRNPPPVVPCASEFFTFKI